MLFNYDIKTKRMCILSGCDYLENLPGIGLGKAKKFLKSINKNDIEQVKLKNNNKHYYYPKFHKINSC
jgi:5'-3' exonuclease